MTIQEISEYLRFELVACAVWGHVDDDMSRTWQRTNDILHGVYLMAEDASVKADAEFLRDLAFLRRMAAAGRGDV